MTGTALSSARERLRQSFWFLPTICILAAGGAATGLVAVDRILIDRTRPFILDGGPEAARTLLNAVASSMITFTALVFTITIVVLQLASGQFSPRVLRTFFRDRLSQVALGVFTGTFVYALIVLSQVRNDLAGTARFVPEVAVSGAFAMVLLSVALFIVYVHHIASSIRVVSIIESVAAETRDAIERCIPASTPDVDVADLELPEAESHVITSSGAGTLNQVGEAALVAVAADHDVRLQLVPRIGDFVVHEAPLAVVYGSVDHGDRERLAGQVRRQIGLGIERSMHQDPAFGFRQLVDIAVRALSPGINDPTTAVQVLDRIHDLLAFLGRRPQPSGRHVDEEGVIRLVVPTGAWDDYVHLALDEIRANGAGMLQVARRMRSLLDDLESMVPEEHRRALRLQREQLSGSLDLEDIEPRDRRYAARPDRQGIGA